MSSVVYAGISADQMERNMREFAKDLKETDRRLKKVEKAVAKLKKIKKNSSSRSEEQKKIDDLVAEIGPSIFG